MNTIIIGILFCQHRHKQGMKSIFTSVALRLDRLTLKVFNKNTKIQSKLQGTNENKPWRKY
jgi:hypothetical protein